MSRSALAWCTPRTVAFRVRTARVNSFEDFWPYYLREHSQPGTRRLHVIGTSLSLLFIPAAAATRTPWLLLVGLAFGYALAWIGHFFIEHNRPATFQHPLWSFRADFRMLRLALLGRLDPELSKAGVSLG